jgi:glycosyltransferase involved in cell wall biosynthesis
MSAERPKRANFKSKRKVLLIGSLPPPYHGGVMSFQRILNSEIQFKFDVEFLDISDHRSFDNIGKIDVGNILIGINNLIGLLSLCRKKPQISYLILSPGGPALYRDCLFIFALKKFSNAKIIAHLHVGTAIRKYYENTRSFAKYFLRNSIAKCDKIIVLSNLYKKIFEGLFPLENIAVISNGLDSPMQNIQPVKNKGPIVSYMGLLSETKGIYDFIQAAVILSRKHDDIKFMLAGDWHNRHDFGKFKLKCSKLISENGIDNRINFLGNISGKKKEQFFAQTKVFVMPSYYKSEGQPAVIIEAMASGIPVVSTDHEAIPEMVIEGETGFIVPIKSPEKICQAVDKLLTDTELYKQMCRNSTLRYTSTYSKEKHISRLIDLFNSI